MNEFGSPRPRVDIGPGLHDQGGVPRDLVPLRGLADVAHMEMAGQKQVGADASELLHGHAGSTDQMFLAVARRQLERMVRHDDPHDMRRRGRQALDCALHLVFIQPAAAARTAARALFRPTTIISSSTNTGVRSRAI